MNPSSGLFDLTVALFLSSSFIYIHTYIYVYIYSTVLFKLFLFG